MKAVILAGGEATRLRPLTCNTAKIMVPLLNRPFLEHLIHYLKKHNITEVILALGKQVNEIQGYFGDGSSLGAKISYSVEDIPLGTAGAVKNAQKFLDDSFIVLNGDIFTDLDISAMMSLHHKHNAMATIALTPVDNPTIYGVVETNADNRVRRFVEKPSWDKVTTNMINAGIYILELEILNYIASNVFFMFERDVFPPLLERGENIYSYPSEAYWIDIGTPEKYLRLHHDLLNHYQGANFEGESVIHPSAQIEGPVLVGEGCSIDKDAVIKGPACLGQGCHIEEGAIIEGAVLWQRCRVGKEAKLRNCMVGSNARIDGQSEVMDNSVLGDNVRIGKGSKLFQGIRIWPKNPSS